MTGPAGPAGDSSFRPIRQAITQSDHLSAATNSERLLCAGCRWRVRRGRAEQNGQFWRRFSSPVVLPHQHRIAYGASG